VAKLSSLEVHVRESEVNRDLTEFRALWRTIWGEVNDRLSKIRNALNSNEGSAIVADALPTAEMAYQGRIVCTMGTGGGGVDQFWMCRSDGAGGYEWKEVQFV
jgi:hypothetical protein